MDLIILITLLIVCYISGSIIEKKHYSSIREREKKLGDIPIVNIKDIETNDNQRIEMVTGNSVVAADYFKRFLASLRNLFGGKVASYESVLDRARRESVLRVKQQASGAKYLANLRYQTATIGKEMVEVIAYATAVYEDAPVQSYGNVELQADEKPEPTQF